MQVRDFWKLAVTCQLLTPEQCQKLARSFSAIVPNGGPPPAAKDLAQWLVRQRVINRYQARELLSGRREPLVYGPYRIIDCHSKGRLEGVYRAVHIKSRHVVSLVKVPNAASDPVLAQAVTAFSPLRERHLSRVFHWFTSHGQRFVACQDLNGQSLTDRLSEQRVLPSEAACRIALSCAEGLLAMARVSATHGSVCPENVWLSNAQRAGDTNAESPQTAECDDPTAVDALLLGFPYTGIAVPVPNVAGTASIHEHAAPETLRGEPQGMDSDLYSLGSVLYTMLTGRRRHPTSAQVSARIDRGQPAQIDWSNAVVPEPVRQLVARLLSVDPKARCPRPGELISVLRAHAGLEPAAGSNESSATEIDYELWLSQEGHLISALPASSSPPHASESKRRDTPAMTSTKGNVSESPPTRPAVESELTAFDQLSRLEDDLGASTIRIKGRGESTHGKRQARRPLLLASIAISSLILLVGVAGFVFIWPDNARTSRNAHVQTNAPAEATTAESHHAAGAEEATPPLESRVGPLWQSPTNGQPIPLDYLPAGVQMVVSCRPGELLAIPQGAEILEGLGDWGSQLRSELETQTGIPLENMELVVSGYYGGGLEPPLVGRVVKAQTPAPIKSLLESWNQPTAETIDGATIYHGGDTGYFVPREGLYVIAPYEELKQIVARVDARAALRTELEILHEHSDETRMLSVLLAPTFVSDDGKGLFAGSLEPVRDQVAWLLGDGARGALVSAHLNENLYLELRVIGPSDKRPVTLASEIRQRISQIPERVSQYLAARRISSYSQPILEQFPAMLSALDGFTRHGAQERQVVLNAYLPAAAGPNLAWASWLALLEGNSAAGETQIGPQATKAGDALRKTTSLSFPRNTLETALQMLADDLGIEIEILGSDLELEGITKNQSFGMDARELPASEILRKILLQANPDGKLVYVVKMSPATMHEVLYITTRAAAAKRGDELPAELQNP